jgi:hypothetical protein
MEYVYYKQITFKQTTTSPFQILTYAHLWKFVHLSWHYNMQMKYGHWII